MNDTPLVSFIIASYNYERFIPVTIKSILEQSVQDFEIVVIDDASTDGSPAVIRSFSDQRIRFYINQTNLGPSSTYNRGAALARGKYITYLDADRKSVV